jgi:hypothetical protein
MLTHGRGESGNNGIVLFGLGESGSSGIVLFGLGESGSKGIVLFGLGESGSNGIVEANEIRIFATKTSNIVMNTALNFLNIKYLLKILM